MKSGNCQFFSLLLDDATADQLCFRETLIVGYLTPHVKCPPPTAVGGLCLNIQKAKGSHPLDRKIPTFDIFAKNEQSDTAIEPADLKEIKEIGRVLSGLLFSIIQKHLL